MKWRILGFFLAALLLLAAAFLLPGLLLKGQMHSALGRRAVQDAAAYRLSPRPEVSTNSLRLMMDPKVEALSLPLEDEELPAQLEALQAQLRTLQALGALPDSVCEELAGSLAPDVDAHRICIVQPEQLLMSEVLVLNLWPHSAEATMDLVSGKLLSLRFRWEDPTLLMQELDPEDSGGRLDAWADYFGLQARKQASTRLRFDQVQSNLYPRSSRSSLVIKTALLTDGTGGSVRFGLSYEYHPYGAGFFFWGPMEEGLTP